MSDFLIEKAKACAVTGHRILKKEFNTDNLKITVEHLIKNGYTQFLIGMALGFDTVCFNFLEQVRKTFDIKIIACIPCKSQSEKFTLAQKREYERMLSVSDMKVLVSEEYTPTCMQKRNRFMVDNASCLIAHLNRDYGGTASTVKYAEKENIKVYYV